MLTTERLVACFSRPTKVCPDISAQLRMRKASLMGRLFFAGLIYSVLATSAADGSVIVGATSVVNPPGIGSFGFENTINQSGLSVAYVSGVTNFDSYLALNPTHFGDNFTEGYTSSEPTVSFDYDLGQTFEIGRLALWFSRFPRSANPSQIRVYTSLTSDFASAFDAGTFFPNDGRSGPAGTPAPVQVFNLADSQARYIRLQVLSKFEDFGVFFSEIAFATTPDSAPVPEPAAISLVLPFIAGMACLRRKRKASDRKTTPLS